MRARELVLVYFIIARPQLRRYSLVSDFSLQWNIRLRRGVSSICGPSGVRLEAKGSQKGAQSTKDTRS